MLNLLSYRNFRLLWLGQLCSQSGDRLTQLVLVALAASRASGSTLSLAKVLVMTSLPALFLSPFAGAFVDRWDRKRTMIVCDFIRAGALLSLPWLVQTPSTIPFYGAVFLIFAVGSFFVPARLAMIPDLVASDRLGQANALFTSSGLIGSTLILIVGAFWVEWIGPFKSCGLNAASYLASAVFILPIRREKTVAGVKEDHPRRIFAQIAEGLRELWRHPETRRVTGLLGLLMAGAGAGIVVGTVLVQQMLGSMTKDLGFLSLWLGVGMLAGSTAYGRWGVRRPHRKVLGLAFLGFGMALWGFVAAVIGFRSGAYASAAAAFLGFWIAPVGVVINTLVHEAHPERLHGRIFSSLGVVINLAWIGSMLTAGWVAERGGRGLFLTGLGAAFALSGGWLLLTRPAPCYTKSLTQGGAG